MRKKARSTPEFRAKFCPLCAGVLRKRGKYHAQCSACDFEAYNNPKVSINVIVVNKKGEVLLGLRKHEPCKDLWNTPGGFIEPRETALQAAKREAKEELGISIGALRFLGTYVDTYTMQGYVHNTLAMAYWCRFTGGTIKAGDDLYDPKFFPIRTLPFPKIGLKSDRDALRDYVKMRRREPAGEGLT